MRQRFSKMSLSCFCVGHLLLVTGLPLGVVSIPSETPLEETAFSFGSGHQLEIASELEMGVCVYFRSQFWGPIWCRPAQALYMLSVSEVVWASVLLCLQGLVLLVSPIFHPHWLLIAHFLKWSRAPEGSVAGGADLNWEGPLR